MTRSPLAALILISTAALAADPKPRVDAEGLPLPAEAVRRFGSAKFLVNNLKSAAFSPDGKTVYTISDEDVSDERVAHSSPGLIAWEVPTGKKLWQAGIDKRFSQLAADPDGKSVWVLENFKTDDEFVGGHMDRVRYSATDGKEVTRTALAPSSWVVVALHPIGLAARVRYEEDTSVWSIRVTAPDGTTSDIRPDQPAKWGSVRPLVWSPKGDRLFVVTWTDEFKDSCLTALDMTSGKQIWSKGIDAPGGWCVSPDGKSVVAVTQNKSKPDSPTIARRLDTETGKELTAVDVAGLPNIEGLGHEVVMEGRIHFHPDGKTLFLLDKEDRTVTIDVAAWKVVPTKVKLSEHTVFSANGKMFAAPSGRHVLIHETETGKRLSPDGPKLPPATGTVLERYTPDDWMISVRFSPTGNRLIRAGGYDGVQVEWEVPSGREVSRAVIHDETYRWERAVQSADGRKKAVPVQNGKIWRVRVTDAERQNATPVELRVRNEGDDCPWYLLQFTPDGKHLIAFSRKLLLWIWDAERGGDAREVSCRWDAEHTSYSLNVGFPTRADGRQFAALLFNGRQGAGPFAFGPARWGIGVYDLPSAKVVREFNGDGLVELVAWSPAGGLVIMTNRTHYPNPHIGDDRQSEPRFDLIHLDPATEQKRVTHLDHDVRCCAMSPVGDTLAIGSSDGLRLYEASTGKLRHRFREQTRQVQLLAFSPDGRTLAAESVDGPLLLWDVRGDLTKPPKPDAAGWEAAWKALGESGAEPGFKAVRLFALHPDDGVQELKRRFAEVKVPSAEVIAALVAKLDDRDYQTREQAERELKVIGSGALPVVKKALAASPSEELQLRANRVLAVPVPGDVLRAGRAVEALTLAGTDVGKKQLAEWAKGPEAHPLTKAAGRGK